VSLSITQVNAFTATPFAGNPAAVCVLPGPAGERWMQLVAREMNLSETAFLHRAGDGYQLRWFTPAAEVALCGHATLAGAHALWEEGHLRPGEPARFHTRSGLLTAERKGEWIEMDFPATPAEPVPPVPGLADALGAAPCFVGRTRFDYLLQFEDEQTVRRLRPDFARLATLPVRGVIVTAGAAAGGFDFVSRFFAPAVGVPEDPVTGSAHCCLAPFWRDRLGKDEMTGYQASARGGVVGVRVAGPRVVLRGQAVTVWRGQLLAENLATAGK
jgi:PhzF family phenazine biosynthesis protein